MKKFFRNIIIIILILVAAFSVYKISNKYNLNVLKDDVECTIKVKGGEEAKAITVDDNNNMYIAYENYIKSIDSSGKEKVIYKNKDLSIEDLTYYDDELIYVSGNSIESFSLVDSSVNNLCSDVPRSGNGIERKLTVKDDNLFITIGAVTNAGIADGDEYDLSPIDIILNGVNYGNPLTGAFKKNGMKSDSGEKISGVSIGNAAIYNMNLKNNSMNLYASGIRGVTGIDFDSSGNLFAIFSGMKDEGLRPVVRDKDYVYEVYGGRWYGWPDYSGGDPITSPRFKNETTIEPLIKNLSAKEIEAPIYQHDEVDSLKELAIDKEGSIVDKDTLITWDKNKGYISYITKDNVYGELLKLKPNSNIEDIVYSNGEILLLDSGIGCVYSLHEKAGFLGFKLPLIIWVFIFILSFALIVIMVWKYNKK